MEEIFSFGNSSSTTNNYNPNNNNNVLNQIDFTNIGSSSSNSFGGNIQANFQQNNNNVLNSNNTFNNNMNFPNNNNVNDNVILN
jgi:hypothetical protein